MRFVAALLACAPLSLWAAEGPAERLLFAEGRPGVQQPYVLTEGKGGGEVKNVLVALIGGPGVIAASEANGVVALRGRGFPAEYRRALADLIGAVATLDVPSDRRAMEVEFRETPEHAKDVGAVVDALAQRYAGAKIYLLGVSNGAISVAYLGARLQGKSSGVIIASSAMMAFNEDWISAIKVPILVVHHRKDLCLEYRYIADKAKWHTLLLVDDLSKPRPGGGAAHDCGLDSAHQFGGRQEVVVAAIAQWINTGKTVSDIR